MEFDNINEKWEIAVIISSGGNLAEVFASHFTGLQNRLILK